MSFTALSTWGVPAMTSGWTFPEPIELTIQNVDPNVSLATRIPKELTAGRLPLTLIVQAVFTFLPLRREP